MYKYTETEIQNKAMSSFAGLFNAGIWLRMHMYIHTYIHTYIYTFIHTYMLLNHSIMESLLTKLS